MAQATRTYGTALRTNFDADLSPVFTLPTSITQVNDVGLNVDTVHGGGITFTDPATMHLAVIWNKSTDGGASFQQFAGGSWDGGVHAHGNPTIIDPSDLYECDPPLLPGTQVKIHVTQGGTYYLGGTVYCDYTP